MKESTIEDSPEDSCVDSRSVHRDVRRPDNHPDAPVMTNTIAEYTPQSQPPSSTDVDDGGLSSDQQKAIADIADEMLRFGDRHWMHDEGQTCRMFANQIKRILGISTCN